MCFSWSGCAWDLEPAGSWWLASEFQCGKHSLGKWPWFPSHTDNHLRAAIIIQPVVQIHLQIQ